MIKPVPTLALNCPFCHAGFLPGERVRRCSRCGCAHHWECFGLHGACAVFGCAAEEEAFVEDWTVDPHDPVPIGEQISYRVLFAIAKGVYQPGDKLPTVREVAARLKVNPNTVSRAYRDLERDGILNSRRGLGVFVREDAFDAACERRQSLVLTRFERAVGEALDAGLDPSEISDVLLEALGRAARARGKELRLPGSKPRWARGSLAEPS